MSSKIDEQPTAADALAAWLDAGAPDAGFDAFARAMIDPDPAVDAVLRARAADPAWERFEDWQVQTYLQDDAPRVPPARWALVPCVDPSILYARRVGPVAPADRAAVAAWLRSRHRWASEGWAGDWLARGDVFAPGEVVSVVDDDLDLCPASPVEPLIRALVLAAAAPGPHQREAFDRARALAEALDPLALRALLAELPDEVWSDPSLDARLGDALEGSDGDDVLHEWVRALATRPGPGRARRCLELLGRAPEAGYGWGADLVRVLHEVHGRAARDAFRAVRGDRTLPFDGGTSAAAAIALILDEDGRADLPVCCTLIGKVRTRPQTLNLVGTRRMYRRSVPVTVDGEQVGTATTEQYPVWRTTDVRFDAVLDGARVPAEWQGAVWSIREVVQGNGWPGPAPLEIRLDRDPAPAEDPFGPEGTWPPEPEPAPPLPTCAAPHDPRPNLTDLPRVPDGTRHVPCAACAYEQGLLAGLRGATTLEPRLDALPLDRAGRAARDARAAWAKGYLAGVLASLGR